MKLRDQTLFVNKCIIYAGANKDGTFEHGSDPNMYFWENKFTLHVTLTICLKYIAIHNLNLQWK